MLSDTMNFLWFRILLPIVLCTMSALAGQPPATKAEQLQAAAQVYDIFHAKCLDCHASTLVKPKGKFGYVLDLERIVSKPKYVIKGEPDKSDIYTLIRDGDMPGEDAKVSPLTAAEKEAVRRWVAIGAPSDLSGVKNSLSPAPAPGDSEAPRAPLPLWKHLLSWIGKFHPVSTHIPIALMLVAVLADALAWWTQRDSWMQTVRFLVIIAALGGIAAAVLGWINAYFSSYTAANQILLWHRWLGTTTAIWALLCAALVLIDDCREGSEARKRFRGALFFGAALVSVTGFLGSALTYGLDHYQW